jgi:hypothetical protein
MRLLIEAVAYIDEMQYGLPGNTRRPRIDELRDLMCAYQASTTDELRTAKWSRLGCSCREEIASHAQGRLLLRQHESSFSGLDSLPPVASHPCTVTLLDIVQYFCSGCVFSGFTKTAASLQRRCQDMCGSQPSVTRRGLGTVHGNHNRIWTYTVL